ncbi:MAG: thermosome subunit alpha [Nitrososphaera sp.]|jgi:thermosome
MPLADNGRLTQLFGDGVKRTNGGEARRYNLLAARLIAETVRGLLGPRGMDKMFIDIMGEVTLTKDGATLLRKIDVEHPAAKVLIEASNAVDNAVGDGTTSVVVLAGALLSWAEKLLEMGISPTAISDGYHAGLETALAALRSEAIKSLSSDRQVMERLAATCLGSKGVSSCADVKEIARLVVDAVFAVADFTRGRAEVDDVKIEQKMGSASDTQLVQGVVIDKTIDSSSMPKQVENARILLINEDLDKKRTRSDAEIEISLPSQVRQFLDAQSFELRQTVQNIIDSGATVVISRSGINTLAQTMLAQAGIISVRRVKENDMWWLEKATGARITRDLDNISQEDLGFAGKVCEKTVGDDRMVFVEGCRNPKSVTLLLRAGSGRLLDEFHRSALDALSVLADYISAPSIVAGGGAAEMMAARTVREKARVVESRRQLVLMKFADALEDIPLTIAANAGMDAINTQVQLHASTGRWCGVNAIERKVQDMLASNVVEPLAVKEQVLTTAVEAAELLLRVDDVVMAKPSMSTHTHADGTTHTHKGGNKSHDHFDRLGKQQRPMHQYY